MFANGRRKGFYMRTSAAISILPLAGRRAARVALLCLVCLVSAAHSPAQGRRTKAPPADVEGVFSSFAVLADSDGDLSGIKVIVLSGQGENGPQYYAVVQFAEGLPEEPKMVKAKVTGTNVSFTLGAGGDTIRYSGTVTAAGLRLKWTGLGGTTNEFLKRQSCK